MRFDLRLQPFILEGQSGHGRSRLDQLGVVVNRDVVNQRGHGLAGSLQEGHGAIGSFRRQSQRAAVSVHVPLLTRDPVGHLQGAVVEGSCQGVTYPADTRAALELHDERPNRGALQAQTQQPGEKPQRQRHEREHCQRRQEILTHDRGGDHQPRDRDG